MKFKVLIFILACVALSGCVKSKIFVAKYDDFYRRAVVEAANVSMDTAKDRSKPTTESFTLTIQVIAATSAGATVPIPVVPLSASASYKEVMTMQSKVKLENVRIPTIEEEAREGQHLEIYEMDTTTGELTEVSRSRAGENLDLMPRGVRNDLAILLDGDNAITPVSQIAIEESGRYYEDAELPCANIISRGERCGFAKSGKIYYIENEHQNKRVQATVRTFWRSGIKTGQFDSVITIPAGSEKSLGCDRGSYIPVSDFRFRIVGCRVLDR